MKWKVAPTVEINADASDATLLEIVKVAPARVHYSQLGEDCLLWHYFHSVTGGFYVDVGCHHPTRYSNTHLLHRFRGWRGINIDADASAIAKFREARPMDINLALGIGASSGEREFTTFRDGAVNTFDPAIARHQEISFGAPTISNVTIRPLAEVLAEHVPAGTSIDYMDIDCEGLDHEVVASNDWAVFRPRIITVEIFGLQLETPLSNPTVAFLKEQGYRIISHCHATTFFERSGI